MESALGRRPGAQQSDPQSNLLRVVMHYDLGSLNHQLANLPLTSIRGGTAHRNGTHSAGGTAQGNLHGFDDGAPQVVPPFCSRGAGLPVSAAVAPFLPRFGLTL